MNKNILFFFSSTSIGGAETNILKISRELSFRGYNIFWCYLNNTGPMLDFVDFEVKILQAEFNANSVFKYIKNYLNFIKENQINCVLNFGLRVEFISRILSKFGGIRLIISNIRSTDDWRKFYHTLLDKLTSFSVDTWVANSLAGKQAFHFREGIPLEKINVIYNFIEPAYSLSEKINILKKSDCIVYIGILANITREKGYFDLIPISKKLNKFGIKHKFVCAGNDMLNNLFHNEVSKQDLKNNFTFLGFISDKEYFFSLIDIFLLPSYLEGMPTALLEAISYGKPVISTNVGGTVELIEDRVNGFLVNPGDIDKFVDTIIILLNNEIYYEIKKNAATSLEHFSKEKIIALWENVINWKSS